MKRHYHLFIVMNFLIPLALGAFIYCSMSPNVIFVEFFQEIVGVESLDGVPVLDSRVLQFIRFYFLDMLWAYALVFALYFILDNNTAGLKKVFLISFVFSTSMELLQLTPLAKGTFDFIDIIVEAIAECIAVFIIKNVHS